MEIEACLFVDTAPHISENVTKYIVACSSFPSVYKIISFNSPLAPFRLLFLSLEQFEFNTF